MIADLLTITATGAVPEGARVVVFDGIARHVLDGSAPELVAVRDELLALPLTDAMPACAALATLARLVAPHAADPETFLDELAEQSAGVRPGPLGLADLVRGGRDHLRGGGFVEGFDDGTDGQVRHFVGVAAAAMRLGPDLTRLVGVHLLRDEAGSADEHLTRRSLALVGLLRSGELTVVDAGDWIERELCSGADP